jgi:hypothetical protein
MVAARIAYWPPTLAIWIELALAMPELIAVLNRLSELLAQVRKPLVSVLPPLA